MYCMTVTYPRTEGSTFDMAYYKDRHIPLCAELFADHGYVGTVLRAAQGSAPGADDVNYASVDILFRDAQSLGSALKAGGKGVGDDVRNYTDVTPVMTFSEIALDV